MYKSKLITLFQQIKASEMGELRRYLESPLFNRRKDVLQLFIVLRNIKRFDKKSLEEETIFQAVYPNQVFDKKQIGYVQSYLRKLIEQFLIYQEFQADKIQQQFYLTRAYRNRNLPKAFQQTAKSAETMQQRQPFRHANYHYWQYQLHLEEYNLGKNQRRTKEMNLQTLSDSFDVFCIANKLRKSCLLLTHQPFHTTSYDFGLLTKMLVHVEEYKYFSIPAIGVYYYAYKALTEEKDTYFKILRTHIAEYGKQFPLDELREIYILAINFVIKQLNLGTQDYKRALFELYQEGLERKALLENGILSQWTYKNVVALGLSLKEFEWVESFIKHYKSYLEEKHKESSYCYNMARLHYVRKEYKEAMLLLLNVRYDDLTPNLTAKILLVKIYYESGEFEALNSLLHSFEVLLHRQKGMGYHKENYLNFVRFTKKLLALNFYDKTEKMELIEAIKAVKILTEKRWLLEILE